MHVIYDFLRWVQILLVASHLQAQPARVQPEPTVQDPAAAITSRPAGPTPQISAPTADYSLFLPLIHGATPWVSPFGVEPTSPIYEGRTYFTRTLELNVGWVRLGTRISWRVLQPNSESDPIAWDQLATFESELRSLNGSGISPVVTITDSPSWATIADWTCGAIRTDKFPAFAEFMRQLVRRYSASEFNVHQWEIGNEPDVDPKLVSKTSGFGCWGDDMDPYYGGRHYGEMLKAVAPVIREADPRAVIWVGGLLLDRPDTPPNPSCPLPDCGRPETFLAGILQAGAASSFDVVAYHAYPRYTNQRIDQDNGVQGSWYSWGGYSLGKARYLRQLMASYGVVKPLMLNEMSLMCVEYYLWCKPPGDSFYQMQADFVVRSGVRDIAENIGGLYWYTLNGPGWRYTGLLDNGAPKPVFIAYQQLIHQLQNSYFVRALDYGQDIQAYAFDSRIQEIQVVWTRTDLTATLQVPMASFIAAYSRDGDPLTPTIDGSDYQLSVGFSPIYLLLIP